MRPCLMKRRELDCDVLLTLLRHLIKTKLIKIHCRTETSIGQSEIFNFLFSDIY